MGPNAVIPFSPRPALSTLAAIAACAVLAFGLSAQSAWALPSLAPAGQVSAAQAPAAQAPDTPRPAPHAMHVRRRPTPAHLLPAPIPEAVPVAPPTPKWPAFDPAAAPTVVWDSQGLSITATNASLQQILKEVGTDTGAKIEGLSSDQRVFGVYGPGQAKDVLSQLLQGSGYNVLMIGDQGHGTPREILLSARQASTGPNAARPNQANNDDDDTEAPEPQPEPEPMRAPMPVGGPPRNPQQIMQEMQQRQQQQQQGQPNQFPPANPQN
jgi:hypothetical protein